MRSGPSRPARAIGIWLGLGAALTAPVAAAALSPLLAWRDPVCIAAGFAGIVAMSLLLVQPLLAAGYLPDVTVPSGRRLHRWIGGGLAAAVALHVAGLWITSPPDVVDALLLRSPTPFSVWGVVAMWALFATAGLALFRRRLRLRWRSWRIAHTSLVTVIVAGSVIHALLVEGTMETISKLALCVLVVAATLKVFIDLRVWGRHTRPR